MVVATSLNFWNRVAEGQKDRNEAAGGQGRGTRLALRTAPSERVMKFVFACVSLLLYMCMYM